MGVAKEADWLRLQAFKMYLPIWLLVWYLYECEG